MEVAGKDMRILVNRAVLKNHARTAVGEHVHRLLDAASQKVHLQIERPAVHIFIEVADIGVVALFEIRLGIVALGQNLGQRRLSASDVACNCYIHIIRYLFYIFVLPERSGALSSWRRAAKTSAVTSSPRRTPVSPRPHGGR